MSEEVEINSEKSFELKLTTEKNDTYLVKFTLENNIEITVNQINGIINKSYCAKYSFEEIRENKYFSKYNNIVEIFDEIKEKIYDNKIVIKENENKIYINLLLIENEKMIFELIPIVKNNNESFNELTNLIIKLNTEINNSNEKIKNLKNEVNQLNNENITIKNEIKDIKEREIQLKNENTKIINHFNLLKNEFNQFKTENIRLKKNEVQLINEVNELKEKLNKVFKERKYISNLDSKIINWNVIYNERLKNWINPSKNLKAEFLFRLSENEDSTLTFHKLCDNKGPTLTLFHVNDGNIVGIYTPLSWDISGTWKNDMDTFIFNLNKNQKYKKLKAEHSIHCNIYEGPYTSNFGCDFSNSLRKLNCRKNNINKYYMNGEEILPNNEQTKYYDLIEIEIFKITFD